MKGDALKNDGGIEMEMEMEIEGIGLANNHVEEDCSILSLVESKGFSYAIEIR